MTVNINSPNPHSEQLSHPKYRSDIDGLRAIAVLSVVGFHAFPQWVKGGFVGVDIFFVISGFLISTIIFGNLEHNTFSFLEFYSRRVKRIFPALLIVLIACYAFGWFALLADEYKQLGNHIAAGAGFVSNLVLWSESGYFDNAAETKPLLHLWSLGIEEQYYIFWPLLVWAVCKTRFNLLTITVAIATASFALNIWGIQKDAVATFYSPQTRFWELFAGSLLAWFTLHPKATKFHHWVDHLLGVVVYTQAPLADGSTLRNVQAWMGAGLTVAAILMTTKASQFPGWWAVLPTLGAALMIAAGRQAWLNRVVLSNKILVWFGLISFPLYLWHWPLLSFARIVESQEPAHNIRIAAVLLSILLAWLTYKLIERPIRFGPHSEAKTIALVVLMAIVGYIGYNAYLREGLKFRTAASLQMINKGQLTHEETQRYMTDHFFLCTPIHIREKAVFENSTINCFQSKQGESINVALIGDSHVQHLFIGLAESLQNKNIVFYMKNSPPRSGIQDYKDIFDYVIKDKNIQMVILSSYWAVRINQTSKDELETTVKVLTDANKRVFITDDVPDFSFDPRQCAFDRVISFNNRKCSEPSNRFDILYGNYIHALEAIEKANPNAKILRTMKYFCDAQVCRMAFDGTLFYRDTNHLNINGSKWLAV